ncbi:MAG TPA: MFS transporter [Hydrogenophaga sp.]|uniref:MFS transporter n=1 Tax=Hydrogenophaga sp. TaxID=1904254 RepID=UPI000A7DB111|nr:MFS transporter [Hydrogenophaga sp.]HAX19341.1 MFS transporter [Hydrogenophaga sp.]HBU18662.1 MFS transporter [Hydrogenophaga sp.]
MSLPTPLEAAPATAATPSAPALNRVLFSLSLSMLLSSLGTSIANVALPTLAQAFSASFQAVQWVVLAYLLTITVVIVTVGRLGDLVGRRRLMLWGLGVFTLASLAGGASTTLWQLIAARVVQGLGAATMMALSMALVSERVPKHQVGSAMGLLGTVSAVGTALGPTLGGLLIGVCGWNAVFWINVPLGLMALAMAYRHLPPDPVATAAKPVRFDPVGMVLLALSLAAYSLAMTLGRGAFGPLNASLLLLALLGLGAFVFAETRVTAPLVRLATFRHPVMATGFAASALVTTVVMATLVVGPFYLVGALQLDATHMGLVMSVGPAVAAVFGAPAGRLVDRVGSQPVGVAGLVTMFLGTTTLPIAATTWGAAGYAGALGLITAGYASFQSANNTAVMASATADQRGVVSGLLNLSRNLGLITGASAMGAVFGFGASTNLVATASAQQLTAGLHLTFLVAAALVALGGVLTWLGATASRRITPRAEAQA